MIEKRQRVITTGKGAAEMGLKEPMKGILISSKAGNVYILRDGKRPSRSIKKTSGGLMTSRTRLIESNT
jgi:hypothetical protein